MKLLKGISLFFIYPVLLLGIGFYTGVKASHYFYPEEAGFGEGLPDGEGMGGDSPNTLELSNTMEPVTDDHFDYGVAAGDASAEAAVTSATLCVDTKYIMEEADILHHTVMETTQRLPDKYIGMDREQFLQAMETYEISPPLSEQERGFVNLEVISFSKDRVVVRKNYKFLQPSSCFYLAAYNNQVVVYLEDKETVYIETHIPLDSLPEDLQEQVMEMMLIEDEEALYSFLENYSS